MKIVGGWIRAWMGTLLMVVGVGLIGAAAAGYAYGAWQEFEVEQIVAARDLADQATATAVASTTLEAPIAIVTAVATATGSANFVSAGTLSATDATSQATASTRVTPVANGPPVSMSANASLATPTSQPTPKPAPTPIPAPLRRVMAPRIALDAPILEARLARGEWQVPKFAAGHLEGTALPDQGSNIVLSGHLQSLSSGNVFSRLNELEKGDEVTLRTTRGDVRYIVEGKMFVPPTELSVVQPTNREELTLLTCWGTWDPIRQDYSLRLIVWGIRAS